MWRWRTWNAAVFVTGFLVLREPLSWLAKSLARDSSELHLVLLAGLVLAVALRHHPVALLRAALERLSQPPRPAPGALAVLFAGLAGWIVQGLLLPANPLLCLWAVGTTYGLVGLYAEPGRWRRSRSLWLLAACVVPLSVHLDAYLGFPARKLTAVAVSAVLDVLGVAHVDTGTVLLTESRAAYVDLPCSGVRSLWSSAVFLLAATGLTRRAIDLRWLGIAGLTAGLVLAANAVRVAVLVALETVAGWPLAAEVLHQPLGVLGFVVACGLGATLLLLRPELQASRTAHPPPRPHLPPVLVGVGLVLLVALPALDGPLGVSDLGPGAGLRRGAGRRHHQGHLRGRRPARRGGLRHQPHLAGPAPAGALPPGPRHRPVRAAPRVDRRPRRPLRAGGATLRRRHRPVVVPVRRPGHRRLHRAHLGRPHR